MDPFLPHLVDHVHHLLRRAEDLPPIWLGAHLFAAASYLRSARSAPDLEACERDPDVVKGCSEHASALDCLAQLPRGADIRRVYGDLLSALLGIEREYREPRARAVFPPATELVPFPADPATGAAIRGCVVHWLRPPSQWAALRLHREDVARRARTPCPPRASPSLEERLQCLGMHWESNLRPPHVRPVMPEGAAVHLSSRAGPSLLSPSFKVALCPLPASLRPQFQVDATRAEFTATGKIRGASALHKHLVEVLEAAQRAGVRLLVLPELCINGPAREEIVKWLSKRYDHGIMAIVAGSSHVTEAGIVRNEAPVLNESGHLIWAHHKRGRFQLPKSKLTRAFFANVPSAPPDVVTEGIRAGNDLRFLDTTIGRVAVLICADVIESNGYLDALARARPDFALIVSMSDETDRFVTGAQDLERQGTAVLFVNAGCVCQPGSKGKAKSRPETAALAFANLSLIQVPGAPPTRVRWLAGREVEWWDFKAKEWRASTASTPLAAALLPLGPPRDRQMCGMVVDLGAHWTHSPTQETPVSDEERTRRS